MLSFISREIKRLNFKKYLKLAENYTVIYYLCFPWNVIIMHISELKKKCFLHYFLVLNCTYSGTVVYMWYVSRTFAVGSFCWLGIKRINVFFIFLFDVRKNSFNFVKPYKYVKKNTENKHFSCTKTLFCGIASPVLHSLAWLPNRLHTLYLYAITYVISYWFSVSVYTAKTSVYRRARLRPNQWEIRARARGYSTIAINDAPWWGVCWFSLRW